MLWQNGGHGLHTPSSEDRIRAALGRLWIVAGVLLAVACSGGGGGGCGGGCGGDGCASVPYPEQAPGVKGGAQIRVTENAFDFLEDNAGDLVGQFLDGGLTFCLPEGDDPVSLCGQRTCPSSGETGCELSLEILDVTIDAIEPSRVAATAVIGGLDPETDFIEVNLLSNCIVRLGTENDAGLSASFFADMTVDPATEDVSISIDPDAIEIGFDQLVVDIDAENFLDIFICEGIDLLTDIGFVRDLLFDNIAGPLFDIVTGLTDEFLCRNCTTDTDCPGAADCVDQGDLQLCIDPNTGSCSPAVLGLEGVVDFGSLLASFAPGLEAELAFQVKAHGYADAVNNGISIGMRSGLFGEKAQCVPAVPPPANLEVAPSQVLRANTDPNGNPYHVGIGISKAALDEALWGAYNGGGLCLAVGTSAIDLLSSGTFGTLLPSLKDLTRNQNTPFVLQLAPLEPPTAVIGAGTIDAETGDLIDPLMTLQWNNLNLHFHAFFDDRMVRIFSLNVDMAVPLALDITDEGLIPVLGDLRQAFTRVEVRDAELLTEEEAFLEGLLPTLIGVALPLLGDALSSPIELPSFSGFALDLSNDSIMGIENNTMIGLFANIALAPEGEEIETPKVDTSVKLVDLLLPPEHLLVPGERSLEGARLNELMASRPVATFEASATLWGQTMSEGEVAFSYRLDGGLWSTFRTDPVIIVDDPGLLLQGVHRLEVRARVVGQALTLDVTPAVYELPIDFESPQIELEQLGDKITLIGLDLTTDAEALVWSVRIDGGDWSEWGAEPSVDLSAHASGVDVDVEVKARDEAGREGYAKRTFAVHGRVTNNSQDSSGCDCSQVSPKGGTTGGLWWLCGVLGIGILIRRRRRSQNVEGTSVKRALGMFGLVLLLAAFGAACDDNKPGANIAGDCPGGCAEGEICNGGVCMAIGCTGDDQCGAGEVCVDGDCQQMGCTEDADCAGVDCGATNPICDGGQCGCEEPCIDGCGEGTFCCESQNTCQALSDPCADTVCEPGFEPQATSEPTGNPDTCTDSGGACGCVALPPLPEGDIGRFVDIAQVGDRIVASAYNETYGDLMVGVLGEGDVFEWQFVDGVPTDLPVVGQIDGPRGGVRAPGDKVGLYSAIGADDQGNLHVTYRDDTNETLKYAHGTPEGDVWSWTVHTIDAEGSTGLWSSIEMDANGVPSVTYMAAAAPVEDASRPVALSKLRHAEAANRVPGADGWTFTDLDVQEISYACGGGCPTGRKCRADNNTCERSLAASRCDDACNSEEACFEDGCVVELKQPAVTSLPEGTGLFTRTAQYDNGDIGVVYHNRTGGDLMFVRQTNGVWGAPVILDGRDSEGNDTTDAGTFCDLAIDASGNTHIAYVDAVTDDLRYINLDAGTSEVVDDGVRATPDGVLVRIVGDAASIAIDADGNPRIAYQDTSRHLLMLARRTGNTWQVLTVAGGSEPYTGAYGFYNRQLEVGGEFLTTTYRYHRQVDPPQNGLTVHRF